VLFSSEEKSDFVVHRVFKIRKVTEKKSEESEDLSEWLEVNHYHFDSWPEI
jgi:hypothetical protein